MDITYYQDGERANAAVLNRPLQQIETAVDAIESQLSQYDEIRRQVSSDPGLMVFHWRDFTREIQSVSDTGVITYTNNISLAPAKIIAPYQTADGEQPTNDYDVATVGPLVEYNAHGIQIPLGNPNPYSWSLQSFGDGDRIGYMADGVTQVSSHITIGGEWVHALFAGGTSYGNDAYSRLRANGEQGEWIDCMFFSIRTSGSPHRPHRTALCIRTTSPGAYNQDWPYWEPSNTTGEDVWARPNFKTSSYSAIVSGSGYGSYCGINIVDVPGSITKNNVMRIENVGYIPIYIYAMGFGKFKSKPYYDAGRAV